MAVEPPAALVEALRALERPNRPGLRWTPEDQWHVTLRFLAAVVPEDLTTALAGLSWPEPVRAEAGPSPVALSRHVWMLPVGGLTALAGVVVGATAALEEPESRPFTGHLTLARAREPKALRGLPAPPLGCSWDVKEVVAFRSELLPGGARHHVIGRYPVGPG